MEKYGKIAPHTHSFMYNMHMKMRPSHLHMRPTSLEQNEETGRTKA